MTELRALQNIGKEMERKLISVGIHSAEELARIGSREAFFRIKVRYPNVCLVHLYTLQGAIDGTPYNDLSDATKRELKHFSDELKAARRAAADSPRIYDRERRGCLTKCSLLSSSISCIPWWVC